MPDYIAGGRLTFEDRSQRLALEAYNRAKEETMSTLRRNEVESFIERAADRLADIDDGMLSAFKQLEE